MSYTDPKTGKFKEGNPGKPKGAVSEKTAIWNEIAEDFKNGLLEQYVEKLKEMADQDPPEFMKRYEAMLEYFAPKLSRAEVKTDNKTEHSFEVTPEIVDKVFKAYEDEWE